MGEVCASSFRGLRSALGLESSKSPLPRRMCSAHVVSAISRGRSMHMREWTIVSGMEKARACCVCLAWASFGLRDVHVKTNGCFWSSMNAIHECVRISAAAARRRVEASMRETLISVRHFPPRHSVCTSNLAVDFGVSVSILVEHT